MDLDHGISHPDHMGTESWRITVVTRIETALDQEATA
jgi:hypothetical protein